MTVPSTPRRAGPYSGTGVLVGYPFGFKTFDKSDLAITVAAADGTESALVVDSTALVTLNPDQSVNPGGVVYFAAAGVAAALPSGYSIVILGALDYEQRTDLPEGGSYRAESVENALDALAIQLQQLDERLTRALLFSVTDVAGSALPAAAVRASKLLGFDELGRINVNAPADGSAVALALDLANSTDASKGAGLSGFDFPLNYATNTAGWGIRTAQNLPNLLIYIPVAEWAAILAGTSTTDVTSYIQTALNTGKTHFAPRGKYCVSATTGLTFPAGGGGIIGAGKNHTLFFGILGTGGSAVQIAAYTAGSIFRRAFNPAGTNAYLGAVRLTDLGIILTHPTASITTTAIQVGIDLRNIGRFDIERVHVGNDVPISSFVARAAVPSGYNQQGYGILTGSVGSSDPAYAGGEVGNIVNCSVWGAFKGITLDDIALSPLSSSHGINVKGCDIQGCHSLLAQEQQYTAGFVWSENTLQNVVRQQGNASPTYCMRIAGYDNEVSSGGYIEAGTCDYLLRFDSASDNNRVHLTHYSATAIGVAAFSDAGRRNLVHCRKDTGSIPGGVESKGLPLVRYDRSYLSMSAVAHWSGSAMVLDGGFGITVTRPTTAGDYLFTFDLPVLDANSFTMEVKDVVNSPRT